MINDKSIETYKEQILSHLNIEEFYKKYAKGVKHNNAESLQCLCAFHEETVASCSIDLKTGLYFCHAGCGGGSIFDFYMKIHNCDFMTALREIAKTVNIEIPTSKPQEKEVNPTIDKSVADNYNKFLLETPTQLDVFIEKRGLSLDTIKRFNLGFDMQSKRYTIPIYDEENNLVNIRKYDMFNKVKGMKMLNYTRPLLDKDGVHKKDDDGKKMYEHIWGAARIFNIQRLLDENEHTILISEGETDCMIAEQNGIPTITVTSGAGTFKPEWKKYFKDKLVVICYDLDMAGQKGALRVAEMIKDVVKEVYILTLPEELGQGGDITDFFVKFKYTADKFKNEILPTAKKYADVIKDQEEMFDINLAETTQAQYRGKRIRTEVLISGKNDPAYIIPSRVIGYCNGGSYKKCMGCKLMTTGQTEYLVDPKKPEVLEFINCTKEQQERAFRKLIEAGCDECTIEYPPGEYINVEEIRVVPKIDMNVTDVAYVEKTLYYIGEGIKTNETYTLEGYVFPDPRKQLATVIIDIAKPSNDSINDFVMTEEKKKELEIFQVKEGQKISEKIAEKYADMERNVTHIYDRIDMFIAYELTIHSPLLMNVDGKSHRGWVNSFVIGDTATGKTEMFSSLSTHYGAGERIGGQGLTIPGLIGTVLQSNSGRWVLRWGLLALNDRRFLVIEEVTDMPEDIMEKLTDIISSGTISINKANGNEKTNARTRLMFVSNTKRGAKLQSYGDGPTAIREIIKKDEDIRRMDFILTVAKNEVSSDIINRPISEIKSVPHIYTSRLNKELTMWGWSRTAEQIIIEPDAEAEIYKVRKRLESKYHDNFPLVESGDICKKIRRLSISAAIGLFSCDDTGNKVIVKKEHVLFIEWWLDRIYSKPSMAYDIYSQDTQRKYMMTEVKRQALIENFKLLPEWEGLTNTLWESGIFRKSDIGDKMGYEKEDLRIVFKWLSNNWLIRSIGNHGYKKEQHLIEILKDINSEIGRVHDINQVYAPDTHKDKQHHHHEEREEPKQQQEKPVEHKAETRVGTDHASRSLF